MRDHLTVPDNFPDRGSRRYRYRYRKRLRQHGMLCSMSCKDDSRDGVIVERF